MQLPHMNNYYGRSMNTRVKCPACCEKQLETEFSCLQTIFVCPHCQTRFSLAQLAQQVDEQQFNLLEEIVGGRLSDRL